MNPALNVPRRHEAVATDTVFSDTPAVDSGVKQAQVFVGRDTLVADAYPMKSGKQFVNTLEDNIRRWGAMDTLQSDSAITEISNKVMDIDRIPSTTPGAEPPRDAKDSGSARSHSTHLETSSSNRP